MKNIPNDEFYREIKNHYPSIHKSEIEIFDDGWDYVVYVIEGKEAFRFPRRNDYAKTLPRETAFLDIFSFQSPILVPKLALRYLSDRKPYVSYTFIPGVQFKKIISETFSERELLGVSKQLGNFLTVLHSFPADKAKRLGITEANSLDMWSKRFNKIKKVVFPYISAGEQEWVIQIFTEFLQMLKRQPPKNRLIHSDIMPEHLIVSPETHELNGVIDFGDIEIADPAYDFTFLRKYGQNFLETAYENYRLERDRNFEKRRQFYEDRLVVTNLEHSLETRDKKMIELHKKQLTDFIASKWKI